LGPAQSYFTQHLPHPPFYFDLLDFVEGRLEAVAYIGGRPVARHGVATPGECTRLEIVVDDNGTYARENEPDVLFAHARLSDANGMLCVREDAVITFTISGATLLGPLAVEAEAGIASVVVRLSPGTTAFTLTASAPIHRNVESAILAWTMQPRISQDDSPAFAPPGLRQ
jgi:beta-galactosidase